MDGSDEFVINHKESIIRQPQTYKPDRAFRGIFLKNITSECPGLPGLIFFTINTTPTGASKKI